MISRTKEDERVGLSIDAKIAVSPRFPKVNGNNFCVLKYQPVAGSNADVISNQYCISYPASPF